MLVTMMLLPLAYLVVGAVLFMSGWSDEIRAMVKFQRFNLMDPFDSLGKFDIVFCRNVAIYFTPETKGRRIGCSR